MLSRKSRRIAHRLTEEDWWVDFHEAFKDDSVEALQTKIDLYEIDINRTWDLRSLQHTMRIIDDSAVQHGALNCVAYLKMMGARSRDRLIGSGLPHFATTLNFYRTLTHTLGNHEIAILPTFQLVTERLLRFLVVHKDDMGSL